MSLANIGDRERLAYTINDFGRMIGLGRSTIYAMISKGEIQVSQVGCRKLISHSEAVALLERSRVKSGSAS
jgi:excisionase family DNA binding protein